MADARRKIEIFSAGCPICEAVIKKIEEAACPSCDVQVLDMKRPGIHSRAQRLGIRSVPAVIIDGKLADCCSGGGVQIEVLKAAGLGQALA